MDDVNLQRLYSHVEKDFIGGYYPVGINSVWHGGIHLRPKADSVVGAFMDGKIVAARLAEDQSDAYGHYGSRNFILLEHERGRNRFYSLYMHLKNLEMSSANASLNLINWLGKDVAKSKSLDALKSGEVVKFDIAVHAGQALWMSGEAGSLPKPGSSKNFRAKILHWEVFSGGNLFANADENRGKWIAVEDTDSDYNMDGDKIATMFPKQYFADKNLTADELAKFYKENQGGQAEAMRWVAAKFVSEWGIPNVGKAVETLHGQGFLTFGLESRLSKYLWWKDALAAEVLLPPKPHVWHYNPIKLIEEFMSEDF